MTENDQSRFTMKVSEVKWSQCVYCTRMQAGGYCPAFPSGIPDDITFNWHDHRNPFPGDHGILFEAKEGFESIDIQPLMPKPKG